MRSGRFNSTTFCVKLSINNHIVGLVHKNHIIRTRLMYPAACKVEFQPFKRLYSQLTFFNFFIKKLKNVSCEYDRVQLFYARLVKSTRLVKSNKMQQNVAKTGWELTKVAKIGRSRSVYGQKRVEGGVGQSREPKLSVCCIRTSAHPFLAKNRPGAPVFGYCPLKKCKNTTHATTE